MTRREAREQALCLIFEKTFQDEPLEELITLDRQARELSPDPFARVLADGVCAHLGDIDPVIERHTIRWDKSRLSRVVLSILRLALFEMRFLDDIPVSVSINEAVELAKRFGGDGDSAFVNGLLGTVARGNGKLQDSLPGKPQDNLPGKPQDSLPGKSQDSLSSKPQNSLPGKPQENLPGKPQENLPGKPQGSLPGKLQDNLPGKQPGNLPSKQPDNFPEKAPEK